MDWVGFFLIKVFTLYKDNYWPQFNKTIYPQKLRLQGIFEDSGLVLSEFQSQTQINNKILQKNSQYLAQEVAHRNRPGDMLFALPNNIA